MSGFVEIKVSMSRAKFPLRITGVVYKQLLPNKPTNNFFIYCHIQIVLRKADDHHFFLRVY